MFVCEFLLLFISLAWSFEFATIELFSLFSLSPSSFVSLPLSVLGLKKEVILFVFSFEDIF